MMGSYDAYPTKLSLIVLKINPFDQWLDLWVQEFPFFIKFENFFFGKGASHHLRVYIDTFRSGQIQEVIEKTI